MKVILSDGTTLSNLILNGNNFISQEYIDETTFDGKLSKVIIGGDTDNNRDEEHFNLKLVQIREMPTIDRNKSEYWFILAEKTQEEILKERLKSTEDALMILMDLRMMGGI
jgi:hypothetical protein